MKKNTLLMLVCALCLIRCNKENSTATSSSLPKDYDGNVYDTIKIGTQVWMLENLKTSHYNDGSAIPEVKDSATWKNTSSGAFCYYGNDSTNNATYGKLYNWFAASSGKLAPQGWHIPTDAEFATLVAHLGGDSLAGDKMKSTILWTTGPGAGTNSSGFNGLPSGFRNSFNSKFSSLHYYGGWWSSTELGGIIAWDWYLYDGISLITRDNGNKNDGTAIRCVRD